MMKREKAIEAIKEFPPEFELEDLIERLIFVDKVEKGIKQLDEGRVIPAADIREIAGKWSK